MNKIYQFLLCVVVGFVFKVIYDFKINYEMVDGFIKPLILLSFFLIPFINLHKFKNKQTQDDKNLGMIIQLLGYTLGYFLKVLFIDFST